jgi:hypothetical protein
MNNLICCKFVNIFIYLLPLDLFKVPSCSTNDHRSYKESIRLGQANLGIASVDVVDNLPFDHIFLKGIHQT